MNAVQSIIPNIVSHNTQRHDFAFVEVPKASGTDSATYICEYGDITIKASFPSDMLESEMHGVIKGVERMLALRENRA